MNSQMEHEIHDLSVVTSTWQTTSMNLCLDDLDMIYKPVCLHMYIYCKAEYDKLTHRCTSPILVLLHK